MNEAHCPVCGRPVSQMANVAVLDDEHMIIGAGKAVYFTPSEWDIVTFLIRKNGGVASRQALHDWLYQLRPDGGPADRTIEVFLVQVRRKISRVGLTLVNVPGLGWRLVADRSAPKAGNMRTKSGLGGQA